MSPDYWVWKLRDMTATSRVNDIRPRPYNLMARFDDDMLNHFALMHGMTTIAEPLKKEQTNGR